MNSELVSVIIPVFNAQNTLRRCIESILSQTHSNIEIILIDDGSTDSSAEICSKYTAKDCRIKTIRKENGGVSSARNAGLSAAFGDYIAFVDADDYIESRMYELLLSRMKKDNSNIGICNIFFEDPDGKTLSSFDHEDYTFERKDYPEQSYFNHCISGYVWNRLFSRDVIFSRSGEHICFDPDISIAEDDLFNYEIFSSNGSLTYSYMNTRLYHYVSNPNGAVNKRFSLEKLSYFDSIEKEIGILEANGISNDFLKADYVINSIRIGIIIKALKITENAKYIRIRDQADLYKKQVGNNRFPMKLRLKYLIATKIKTVYRIKIMHDNKYN